MEIDDLSTPEETAAATVGTVNAIQNKSLMGVQIEITVSVGKARISLAELIKLQQESVLKLDSRIEDPVDIYVGERLIARGELEEAEGDATRLGVRLTEVADLSEGV